MKLSFRLLLCLIVAFVFGNSDPSFSLASPPPSEISKIKNEAPLHLIGAIQHDQLLADLTTDPDQPKQYRTIQLLVTKVVKTPNELTLQEGDLVSFNYHYIPSWSAIDYVGASPILVSQGDMIEVWLTSRNSSFEPALSGYTLRMITSSVKHTDYVQEPILHKIKRLERDYPLELLIPMSILFSLVIWYFIRLWRLYKLVSY
ncbi:hypothetical protein [Brevibacillus sp. SYSU BS000544]|uniref:hypothetical protein n=1 Tax=Brevibacillus sp. SYSU BS000544 TaxID=3416443 RepID=UPI003CE4D3CE